MDKKTKMIGLRISPDLENKVKEYAKKHKWSKSSAICEILTQHFNMFLTN
jgi:predicted DNA-binding protein